MKNTLTDLNNYLFETLERLIDDDMTEESLKKEITRSQAVTAVACTQENSPLHATGFLYNDVDYIDGMEHCFEALSRCDELWLCGNWRDSRGCNMEYAFAKGKGIPIKFIGGGD
jgi:hypothetical protein